MFNLITHVFIHILRITYVCFYRYLYNQLDLKYTELEMDYEKLKSEKGSRASIVQEANTDLLRELERYSGQLKDILKENGELKTLYLQVTTTALPYSL